MSAALVAIVLVLFGVPAPGATPRPEGASRAIAIPGGEGGIGFDDLRWSAALRRVLLPAGRTGALALVDPGAGTVDLLTGFAAQAGYSGGHGEGITSVDEGEKGLLYVTDRTAQRLDVVDPASRRIVAGTALGASPDYVRWIPSTREVWVTEPEAERIEIFRAGERTTDAPKADGAIRVAGGPESLVFDAKDGVAFSHLWKGRSVAIDAKAHRIAAEFENGCDGSRGIALDAERGFLFVGCAEGRAVSLDTRSHKILGRAETGGGVDIIAYGPAASRLYVPGGKSGTLTILDVSGDGRLAKRHTVATAAGVRAVAVDDAGTAVLPDPRGGRVLVVEDRD